jgi:hypothetical protein
VSKTDLALALRERWPAERILCYCRLNEPSDGEQNLVATHEVWKGVLLDTTNNAGLTATWYATVESQMPLDYSVTAYTKKHYWIIEIGNIETLKKPPYIISIMPQSTPPQH